jgi:hypothetical protein
MNRFQSLELVERVTRMEVLIDDALPLVSHRPPAVGDAAAYENERKTLDSLADQLLRDTRTLAAAMRAMDDADAPGIADPELWIEPIVVYIDELVTCRLTPEGLLRWPLLQHLHYGFSDGGERFYDRLEDLLARGVPFDDLAPYLFCLHKGFCGKYQESEHEEIRSYVSRIRASAPALEDAPSWSSTRPVQRVRKPLSPLQMYGIAALVFVAFSILQIVLSNAVTI